MDVVDCIVLILILSVVALAYNKRSERLRTFCMIAILVVAILGVFASIRIYSAMAKVQTAINNLEKAGTKLSGSLSGEKK